MRREERRQALGSQDDLEQGKKWSEELSYTTGCEEEMRDPSLRAGPCLESGLEWVGGFDSDLKVRLWSSPQTCRPSPFPGPSESFTQAAACPESHGSSQVTEFRTADSSRGTPLCARGSSEEDN